MKLKRTRRCKLCPWRTDVDRRDISNGYSETTHRALVNTIAAPGDLELALDPATHQAMSCHEQAPGAEAHCVGWLVNQLGVGDNIALRLAMLDCENVGDLRTVGEQHTSASGTRWRADRTNLSRRTPETRRNSISTDFSWRAVDCPAGPDRCREPGALHSRPPAAPATLPPHA